MKDRFANLYGQEAAVGHLQNALRTGRISQVYILCGEEGSGRMQLAMCFAKTLQCHHRREQDGLLEACGECHSCRQAESGNHPDIIPVYPQKESRTGALLVDDARLIKDDVMIRPYSSDWKIYIIPHADRMNQQAQNALLKTLEEPPSYAVLILLAESTEGFLPTVLSRCVLLRLHPVEEEQIAAHLTQDGTDQERALLCARLSHGNPGRAAALAQDEEKWTFRNVCTDLLLRLPSEGTLEFTQFAAGITPEQTEQFLDVAESWIRDLAVLRSAGSREKLIFEDHRDDLETSAGRLGLREIQMAFSACSMARARIYASRHAAGSDAQILEMLLLSLRTALRRTGH